MDNSQLMILAATQWIDKARCDNKFVKRVTRCYGDQSQQPKTLSVIFGTECAKRTNHYYCHYELLLFVHFFVRCCSLLAILPSLCLIFCLSLSHVGPREKVFIRVETIWCAAVWGTSILDCQHSSSSLMPFTFLINRLRVLLNGFMTHLSKEFVCGVFVSFLQLEATGMKRERVLVVVCASGFHLYSSRYTNTSRIS